MKLFLFFSIRKKEIVEKNS